MTWTDKKRWWMDLLKWAITSIVALLVGYFVLDTLQEKKQEARNRADATFKLQVGSLQDFQKALLTYEVAAHSAYTDLYQWKGKSKTTAMEWYERNAYAGLLLALSDARNRFRDVPSVPELIKKLDSEISGRHKIYDKWVDYRLDREESTPIDPRSTRAQFDSHSATISKLRADIVHAVEADLLRVK